MKGPTKDKLGEMPNGRHFELKGKRAEEIVYNLAVKSFLSDWCFWSPEKPNRKEFCDLLVAFDDIAIIWSVKDVKLDKNGFYKKSDFEKSVRQLKGAKKHLLDLQRSIVAENPKRRKIEIDPAVINRVFLISVFMGDGESCGAFMDTVGEHQVHVFTGAFTELILNELDTISDFLDYLIKKEALLTPDVGIFVIEGGEEELLACYLNEDRSFKQFEGSDFIHLNRGIWSVLKSNPEFVSAKENIQVSYYWDHIISRVHEGSPAYERLARELARPNRLQRSVLANAFCCAHEQADSPRNTYDVHRNMVSLAGTTYCFLFQEPNPSTRSRAEDLKTLCLVARGHFPENQRVLGIATDMALRPECAFDFCFLAIPEITTHLQGEIQRFRNSSKIFLQAN